MKLARVLEARDGVIKARRDWRTAYAEAIPQKPPRLSYLLYESWCKQQGKEPTLSGWLSAAGLGDKCE